MSVLTADRAGAAPPRRTAGPRPWLWLAGLASAGAGVLHVAAAVQHREVGQLVIGLFLLVAAAQVAGGWLLVVTALRRQRPGAWAVTAALAGTLALIALYVVAHTTDVLAGLTGHGTTSAAGLESGHGAGHGEAAAGAEPQGHSVVTGGAVALDLEPAHVADPPGLVGTATVALELVCLLGLTALLPRRGRTWALNAQLAIGALGWARWLTGVLG